MARSFYPWLAGLIDGDGCFSLSLSVERTKNPLIHVTPQISITARELEKATLEYIQQETGMGKIYSRGRSVGYPLCAWQVIRLQENLDLAKKLFPHLYTKKQKCKKFIEVVGYWIKTAQPFGYSRIQAKGLHVRTQVDLLKVIKVACDINADRQTRRYKNKLSFEEWEPLIKEWYPI